MYKEVNVQKVDTKKRTKQNVQTIKLQKRNN